MVSKKSAKRAKPQLKVVFDTSAIYTGSNSDLLQQTVLELINEHSSHQDLLISWHLPDVVRHERQYQMEKASLVLLPSIRKIERIIGLNLNITEDIVKQRVKETVDKQLTETNLQVLSLDTSKVDWNSMLMNSVYRLPPFDAGEKEKGFRDALISEEFLQLVATSPVTPKLCLIALVVGDGLMADFVKSQTKEAKNVRILPTIEDLKGLINTLVAAVSEEFVAGIQLQALRYFFIKDDEETLYYKENVREKLRAAFASELAEIPTGAEARSVVNWLIHSPQFVKKDGRRVFWATRISVNSEAFVYEPLAEPQREVGTAPPLSGLSGLMVGKSTPSLGKPMTLAEAALGYVPPSTAASAVANWLSGFTPEPRQKRVVLLGKSTFEITWSILVSTRKIFSSPRIDEIKFIETTWTAA
jgi:hypothetical protein